MRTRRPGLVREEAAPANLPRAGDRIAWFEWRRRERRTAAHAFRITEGARAARSLCRNAPGKSASDVREVARPVERCGACLGVLARLQPLRAEAAAKIGAPAPPPKRVDPRTVYVPTHGYDDFERELRGAR